MRLPRLLPLALLAGLTIATTFAEPAGQSPAPAPSPTVVGGVPVNYDEAKVGSYTLPDPLLMPDGKLVKDAKTWYEKRRPEIVRLFEEHQFGKSPARPKAVNAFVFDKGTSALDGKALRKQVTIYFGTDKAGP